MCMNIDNLPVSGLLFSGKKKVIKREERLHIDFLSYYQNCQVCVYVLQHADLCIHASLSQQSVSNSQALVDLLCQLLIC